MSKLEMKLYLTREGQAASELLQSMLQHLSKPVPGLASEYKKTGSTEDNQKLEDELAEVKVAYTAICENVERLQKNFELLKHEAESKAKHIEVTSRKKADIENQYELLSKTKISSHDEELLETTKLRYKALRNMTQVRFTFEKISEDTIEGYVFNSQTKNIEHFSIPNVSQLKNEQISEKIRACMEKVAGKQKE